MKDSASLSSLLDDLRLALMVLYPVGNNDVPPFDELEQEVIRLAYTLLMLCFPGYSLSVKFSNMNTISFRNGVLIFPLGKARMATKKATTVEVQISLSDPFIAIVRRSVYLKIELRVVLYPGEAIHNGYLLQYLRPTKAIEQGQFNVVKDTGTFLAERYVIFDAQGVWIYRFNIQKNDFNIRQIVKEICNLD